MVAGFDISKDLDYLQSMQQIKCLQRFTSSPVVPQIKDILTQINYTVAVGEATNAALREMMGSIGSYDGMATVIRRFAALPDIQSVVDDLKYSACSWRCFMLR